jgi:hypothetical protein
MFRKSNQDFQDYARLAGFGEFYECKEFAEVSLKECILKAM